MKHLKRFFCWIEWHSFLVGYDPIPGETGFNCREACKWCGGHGLVDSQGNLFNVKHK